MSSGYDVLVRRWAPAGGATRRGTGSDSRARALVRRAIAAPELLALLAIAAALNLWNLSINGWANTYYSGAMRAMSTSWHDFLYASLDRSGLMTLDKPPLSLWVQALSVRVFGLHPLSILVPQALMGVAATALLYDLTRRRFGRLAGFVAGLALATTPVIVAVSRHNNPDELLVLCSVAALWCLVRALQRGATRWLVLSAVCVGFGFETKMLVAFMVVPGFALAWLWAAPVPMLARLRRGIVASAAGLAVALAWPILVTLTPAADRPWISGTSDNSIWSLIFGYNGLGRVAGQTGGPGGGGGPGGANAMFGGATGPFRLLASGLGDQAGWLLGTAVVAAVALLVLTRLRRNDPRTGWLLASGGALATSVVVFSFASGIFHPYYVSFVAPWAAALVGAGAGLALPGRDAGRARRDVARLVGPALLVGGAITELVVLGGLGGQLAWGTAAVVAALVIAGALALAIPARVRAVLVVAGVGALMLAPAAWATETLGHATSGTFPAGGPASAGGGFGGGARFGGAPGGGARFGGAPGGRGRFGGGPFGGPPGGFAGGGGRSGAGGPGGFGRDSTELQSAIAYAKAHGGGTIGVESQSSAADAILRSGADVAGLGGFSGRESTVSVTWLATKVASGHLRWVLGSGGAQMSLPGDTRSGSSSAFGAVAKACTAVNLGTSATATTGNSALGSLFGSTQGSATTLYDCQGRAAAILAAGSAA